MMGGIQKKKGEGDLKKQKVRGKRLNMRKEKA